MRQEERVPRRSALVLTWCTAAVLLLALVASVRLTRSPADDPDPARQRPGILDLGELPVPAPEIPGVTLRPGAPTVVFFASARRADDLCRRLAGWDPRQDLRVVVVGSGAGRCGEGAVTVDEASSAAAEAYGLPRPHGEVDPTGYAIVDGSLRIRYRTLDPVAAELLDEVSTMARGL